MSTSAQYPITAPCLKGHKAAKTRPPSPHPNSRDVSGIVTYAEVLLEIHGLVGGAELEERRETSGEGVTAKQMFCIAGRDSLPTVG